MIRRTTAGRLGAVLLLVAPIFYLLAETVAASAWTDPDYDYLYHYISDLGISGPPSHVFGQDVYSPLAWVMNTGFVGHGVLVFTAIALLVRSSAGARPKLLMVLSSLFSVGIALVGLFQGSQGNVDNGLIIFHMIGAQLTIVIGNVLFILFGVFRNRLGLPRRVAVSTMVLGIVGLLGFVAFMIDVRAGINVNVGLFERLGVYPIVLSQLAVSMSLLRQWPAEKAAVDTEPARAAHP